MRSEAIHEACATLGAMMTPFTYEFGYSWTVAWGAAIPLVIFGALAAAGWYLRRSRWLTIAATVIAAWSLVALGVMHVVVRLNLPQSIPVDEFMSSGTGEAVDIGAGSGRSTVGLLLARPATRVTAVDIYDGYFGIDDNTPERLMLNARIAGVAERADARVGDARALPLPSDRYDAAISSYAIDHLRRDEIPTALREAARILKPNGEFLLMIVNVDRWALLTSPAMAHHPRANAARWRSDLQAAGFDLVREGTQPMMRYFYSKKR